MNRAWLVAGLVFSSCVPWTVRPIEKSGASEGGHAFDASAYLESIWDSKVMPAIATAAVWNPETRDLPAAFLVKGSGRVLSVDTSSRTGLMMIDLAPYDGRADLAVQIGPVLRGTALRDALPFIQFSQFVNQLEFARVGNALNDRAWKTALASLNKDGLTGRLATFAGAASRPAGSAIPEVVPVQLSVTQETK
jgi:predicted lipoprotein